MRMAASENERFVERFHAYLAVYQISHTINVSLYVGQQRSRSLVNWCHGGSLSVGMRL